MSVGGPRLPPFSHDDISILREKIQHENDLINHRISWMVLCHGLLLNFFSTQHSFMQVVIAVLAIVITASVMLALSLSGKVFEKVRNHEEYKLFRGEKTTDDPVYGALGHDLASNKKEWRRRYGLPLVVVPCVFMFLWIILAIHALTRWAGILQ